MKTVLHLIETSGPGGAEKMLISLVEHLDKSQYGSIICLLKDGWLNRQLRDRGCETVIIPQNHSVDFGWLFKLMRLIRKRAISVIHAHEFVMNAYGSIASVITGVPIVTTVHGRSYYCEKLRRRLAYRFAARQSVMVAVSDSIMHFLVREIGIKPERIRRIYNGVSTNLYHSATNGRERTRRGG